MGGGHAEDADVRQPRKLSTRCAGKPHFDLHVAEFTPLGKLGDRRLFAKP